MDGAGTAAPTVTSRSARTPRRENTLACGCRLTLAALGDAIAQVRCAGAFHRCRTCTRRPSAFSARLTMRATRMPVDGARARCRARLSLTGTDHARAHRRRRRARMGPLAAIMCDAAGGCWSVSGRARAVARPPVAARLAMARRAMAVAWATGRVHRVPSGRLASRLSRGSRGGTVRGVWFSKHAS